ncbi:MAG: lysine--tRNA ligase [Parcubacteria group bacterium]|nr:lysine--tRNA ligase [Parcubacteria group bacterium]
MAESNIQKIREEKLQRIREEGINPYPRRVTRTCTVQKLLDTFNEVVASKERITVVGRVMSLRTHGGSFFLTIRDGSGSIQGYLKRDVLGDAMYQLWHDVLDVGDIVGVTGFAFHTQKGEPTIESSQLVMLAKALAPLPEKWHGLQNVEERFRKRYIDLLVNDEVRTRFMQRSRLIKQVRTFLWRENFIEVETPILQSIPGGTTARPFETRLNALDMRLYLRVAPELYLKRLLVAGFEQIFEIGRNFRNEGMDREHNPEFTMLECYRAYSDDEEMIAWIERMVSSVVEELVGARSVHLKDYTVDFTPPWPQVLFNDLLEERVSVKYDKSTLEELRDAAARLNISIDAYMGKGRIADEIFKKVIRPHILSPLVVRNHPLELSPLAKSRENIPHQGARFQVLAGGMELINGFAELNDPVEQRERFLEQVKQRAAGDEEAHWLDEDFLEALLYGMPPAAGFGMGIDRLAAVLTGAESLREIILFPTMRRRDRPSPVSEDTRISHD